MNAVDGFVILPSHPSDYLQCNKILTPRIGGMVAFSKYRAGTGAARVSSHPPWVQVRYLLNQPTVRFQASSALASS